MGWERQRPHPSYLLPGRLPDRDGLSRLAAGHREAAAALTDRRPGPAKGWEADNASAFPESSVSEASGGHEGGVPSPIDRTACLMNTGQVRQAFGKALRVGVSGCDLRKIRPIPRDQIKRRPFHLSDSDLARDTVTTPTLAFFQSPFDAASAVAHGNAPRPIPLTRCAIRRLHASGGMGNRKKRTTTTVRTPRNNLMRQRHGPSGAAFFHQCIFFSVLEK
jgi:hypothetical protein